MSTTFEKKAESRRRWHVDDLADGIRLRIPPRRRWFHTVFSLAWLTMWAATEGSLIGQWLRHEAGNERLLLLAFWTFGGLMTLGAVLWQLAGEVVLEVRQGTFRHRISFGPLAVGRSYDLRLIHNLHASRVGDSGSSWVRSSDHNYLARGLIRFDYGQRAVTIRPDLEPSEATNVVNLLARHIVGGAT